MSKQIQLKPNEELRLHCEKEIATITVHSGDLHYFGSPLLIDREYTFQYSKCGLSTFTGCKMTLGGQYKNYYISDSNTLVIRKQLQVLKDIGIQSPTILFLGPTRSTVKTILRYLGEYYNTLCEHVYLINMNLEAKQNITTFPGCLSVSKFNHQIGLPFTIPLFDEYYNIDYNQLIYYVGQESCSNIELQFTYMQQMMKWMASANSTRVTLIYGDYVRWKDFSQDQWTSLFRLLNIQHVVIAADERLKSVLHNQNHKQIQLHSIPESPGYVAHSAEWLNQKLQHKYQQYFHSDSKAVELKWVPKQWCKIRMKNISRDLLPIQTQEEKKQKLNDQKIPLELVDINSLQARQIIGITDKHSATVGFMYIQSIDKVNQTVTVIKAIHEPFPEEAQFIVGTLLNLTS